MCQELWEAWNINHPQSHENRVKMWALLFTVLLLRKLRFRRNRSLDQDYMGTHSFSLISTLLLFLSFSTSLYLCLSSFSSPFFSLSSPQSLSLSLDSEDSMTYSMKIMLHSVWQPHNFSINGGCCFLGTSADFSEEVVLELEVERHTGQVTVTFFISFNIY